MLLLDQKMVIDQTSLLNKYLRIAGSGDCKVLKHKLAPKVSEITRLLEPPVRCKIT